ncbi:MAG: ATP-binding cassette domain-containing protein, partial [Candidatus Riflebacteria bacterium]
MQTCEEKNFNRLIAEVHNHVGVLLREIPRLTDFDGRERLISDCDRSAFNQLKKLPGRHLEIDDKPVIICVLVGPSGSGKSTIFNLLTGLETPAGGAVRPMTFASTVAIPEPIYQRLDTAMFFPGFNVVELTCPTDLRNRHTPVTQIFKAPYSHPDSDFWLCLVDIPDFNTTETTNWDKAEQMIERADSVIYTVFTESYKDQKAYDFLKKCCRFSGSLTYLLTKIDAENPENSAHAVRDDLLEFAGRDLEFKELRSNQISLHSYLQHAPFYYSPRSMKIELDDFLPLANTSASFKEFLFGQKGLEIIFSHYLQSISVGVKSGLNICENAKLRNDELQEQINRLNKHLKIAA